MENSEGLCRAIREEGLLIRLLDGELPASDENRVLGHLRACHECLGVVADLLYTDTKLKDLFARKIDKIEKNKEERREEKRNGGLFMLEVDKLPIGKTLDRDLLDETGLLLVAAGTVLSPKLIDSIKRRGIEKLAVRTVEEAEEAPIDRAEVAPVSIREVENFILESGVEPAITPFVRDNCQKAIRECYKDLEASGTFSLPEAENSALEVAGEILSKPNAALALTDLILVDPGLHAHSVNVLVLFLMIARAMGHPAQLIKEHATGALLHDIGRIALRQKNAGTAAKMTREEEDAGHTEAGYAYLWNFGGMGQSALKMVMNHHERYDGKGYPRSLKGTALSDWDQLLILSNTYDKMSWNRDAALRSGYHRALTNLIQDGSKFVRKGIVTAAIQTFGYYPPGSWVKLNNGEIGVVAKAHPGSPLKPLVSVFYAEDGKKLSKPRSLDLGYSQNAYIQGPVSVDMGM